MEKGKCRILQHSSTTYRKAVGLKELNLFCGRPIPYLLETQLGPALN